MLRARPTRAARCDSAPRWRQERQMQKNLQSGRGGGGDKKKKGEQGGTAGGSAPCLQQSPVGRSGAGLAERLPAVTQQLGRAFRIPGSSINMNNA